ncbi:glutathione s-transferase [Stylonychia lemnae]|uniref:Glutathione s-transferase n=1 Tax=Stylonychia lemnae TaxID=5949 RepID=A0A078APU9_STYLE|nr:glutathione s-transferase [Stylonychia lemnae]|eukprot:CDW83996.1 glutathione s-transferase [Stylonychia lemnae]
MEGRRSKVHQSKTKLNENEDEQDERFIQKNETHKKESRRRSRSKSQHAQEEEEHANHQNYTEGKKTPSKRKYSEVKQHIEETSENQSDEKLFVNRIFYKAQRMSRKRDSHHHHNANHKIKLYYFEMYGRAEPSRMLLSHAGVEYEDVYTSHEEFQKIKGKDDRFEFDALPVLELDGEYYAESLSILRLLGKLYGYYPEDPIDAWKVDSMIDLNYDLHDDYWKFCFQSEPEKIKKCQDDYFQKHLPKYCQHVQRRLLKAGNIYISGDQITIADFLLSGWAYMFVYNESCIHSKEHLEVIKNYPDLEAYFDRMAQQLKEHLDKRPKGLMY